MSVQLFVAEKPSVARDLARSLGAGQRRDGYFSGRAEGGGEVWVAWCLGHLVEIAEPHEHDPRWKRWDPSQLPMLPEDLKLRPIARTRDHYQKLRKLLRDGQVTEVINACDAGREGELIFRYVYELAKCRKPVRRLWLSSLTPSAIRGGLARLRPGAELDGLGAAARCRAEADWLVGMNATRAYTSRCSGLLSLGRVQTPTLALLVEREEAIERFVPTPYWVVDGLLESPRTDGEAGAWQWEARWHDRKALAKNAGSSKPKGAGKPGSAGKPQGQHDEVAAPARLATLKEAEALVEKLRGQPGRIEAVQRREEQVPPRPLHHLTSLQQEANRRFGLSAKQTLDAAQALYERHKLLTYPRTDSRHLTPDVARGLDGVVSALARAQPGAGGTGGRDWSQVAGELQARGLPALGRRFVDASKVGDHHALIPTSTQPNTGALGANERRVYELVVRRFLAAFLPSARYARARIDADVAGELLRANGRVRLDPGWEVVDPPASARKGGSASRRGSKAPEEAELPPVEVGASCQCLDAKHEGKETRPPKRYTEASLLGAMERAGRSLDEVELRAALRELGLGTPATRAATIETLLRRSYAEREGKALCPTKNGKALVQGLPVDELKSARLTGAWESRLTRVARGEDDPRTFRADLRRFVAEAVAKLLEAPWLTLPEGDGRGGGGSGRGKGRGRGRGASGARSGRKGGSKSWGNRRGGAGSSGGRKGKSPGGSRRGARASSSKGSEKGGWEAVDAWLSQDDHFNAGPNQASAPKARGARPSSSPRRATPARAPTAARKPAARTSATSEPVTPKASGAGPRCRGCKSGQIVRGNRGWGCNRWREGCHLVVWFVHQGVQIPADEADRLFRRGQTRLFTKHPGSGRKARLVLEPGAEGNVRWEETKRK